ncbi:unnamed protein product [Cuscuta epithymum]|uniref:Myb-like domain-containing protein n=1 Tax=Cuscuta epithymum TaxID=186058 RepID=A0AAV0GER4_9ASTE|nr:unnamed protein product [Cuscuta epithymum]
MSSTTDAAAEAAIDVLAVAQEKPCRKFPAPCWTQEETLALIEAYRERWYALRRGYLRTADWDSVAEAVFNRCPDASPAKTSAQCRHKMEKLRQRYRAEKQRSLSYPAGTFFSNWFFFENMDAMENGTQVSAAARSNPDQDEHHMVQGFGFKTLIDQNLVKLKLNNPMENPNPNNYASRVPNGYGSHLDVASSKKQQVEAAAALPLEKAFPIKTRFNAIPLPVGFKPKRSDFNNCEMKNGFDRGEGRHLNLTEYEDRIDPSEEYLMRLLEQRNSGHASRGNSSFQRSAAGTGGGVKRERESRSSSDQIALSIRFLAEGFIKIENMKMEMAKEMEQMRMEREMKQSEMILESQKQMLDVFGKVLHEMNNNNKKARTASPPPPGEES